MELNLEKKVDYIPKPTIILNPNTDDYYYCEIDEHRDKRVCPGCAQNCSLEYNEVVSTRQHLVALLLCLCG